MILAKGRGGDASEQRFSEDVELAVVVDKTIAIFFVCALLAFGRSELAAIRLGPFACGTLGKLFLSARNFSSVAPVPGVAPDEI